MDFCPDNSTFLKQEEIELPDRATQQTDRAKWVCLCLHSPGGVAAVRQTDVTCTRTTGEIPSACPGEVLAGGGGKGLYPWRNRRWLQNVSLWGWRTSNPEPTHYRLAATAVWTHHITPITLNSQLVHFPLLKTSPVTLEVKKNARSLVNLPLMLSFQHTPYRNPSVTAHVS